MINIIYIFIYTERERERERERGRAKERARDRERQSERERLPGRMNNQQPADELLLDRPTPPPGACTTGDSELGKDAAGWGGGGAGSGWEPLAVARWAVRGGLAAQVGRMWGDCGPVGGGGGVINHVTEGHVTHRTRDSPVT